jgi:hypothetical protein
MFEQNAELILQEQGTSPTGFDPETGQPTFSASEIRVAVSVEDTKPPTSQALPGLENVLGYVEGRCLESLPEGWSVPTRCKIELELQGQTKVVGFYSLPQTRSRLGLDVVFGQAIAGYLVDI